MCKPNSYREWMHITIIIPFSGVCIINKLIGCSFISFKEKKTDFLSLSDSLAAKLKKKIIFYPLKALKFKENHKAGN